MEGFQFVLISVQTRWSQWNSQILTTYAVDKLLSILDVSTGEKFSNDALSGK